jgi:hypothetical protein
MNVKYIIIGAVLVMLLVAFGRNPIEERRQERLESKKGKDPLMEAINEHNAKPGLGASRSRYRSGDFSEQQPVDGSQPMPGYMYNNGASPISPNYRIQNRNRAIEQGGINTQPGQPPQNSYYPPPPRPTLPGSQ